MLGAKSLLTLINGIKKALYQLRYKVSHAEDGT